MLRRTALVALLTVASRPVPARPLAIGGVDVQEARAIVFLSGDVNPFALLGDRRFFVVSDDGTIEQAFWQWRAARRDDFCSALGLTSAAEGRDAA